MIEFKINFLDDEPKRNSKIKQLLFYLTRPLADFIYTFNPVRDLKIAHRRYTIAQMNKHDFIDEVSRLLYDEVQTRGHIEDTSLCQMLCKVDAVDIFYERKMNGGFDDLNIMQ